MIVCVPVEPDGQVDPRWGRARRVAVADVRGGAVVDWREHDVGWDAAHESGTEGAHHARVARFLKDNGVQTVVAHHMGDGMSRMLLTMGLEVRLGASGDARTAAVTAAG